MVYTNMSVRIDNDGIYFNSELDDVACRIAVDMSIFNDNIGWVYRPDALSTLRETIKIR